MTSSHLNHRLHRLQAVRSNFCERGSTSWHVYQVRIALTTRYLRRALLAEGRSLPWWMPL